MAKSLTSNAKGGYRFLPGIDPYSSGVIAEPGYEIIHVTLARPLPWRDGLGAARQYLEDNDRERHHLCGVELRCPEPHTFGGFLAFNQEYRALLNDWEMLIDDVNPVARTNVAPVEAPPSETVVYGFSYTMPSELKEPTFVVAGAGELPHRKLEEQYVVRLGETSEEAMLEKAQCVVKILRHRLDRLGAEDSVVSTVNVYTPHALQRSLAEAVIPGLPMAAHLGVRWFYTRPPIRELEFEMDLRGVRQDLVLDLG